MIKMTSLDMGVKLCSRCYDSSINLSLMPLMDLITFIYHDQISPVDMGVKGWIDRRAEIACMVGQT